MASALSESHHSTNGVTSALVPARASSEASNIPITQRMSWLERRISATALDVDPELGHGLAFGLFGLGRGQLVAVLLPPERRIDSISNALGQLIGPPGYCLRRDPNGRRNR